MAEDGIEGLLTNTLISYAKRYRKEEDPAIRETIDSDARRLIEENFPSQQSRKDFWTDYTIYKRTEIK